METLPDQTPSMLTCDLLYEMQIPTITTVLQTCLPVRAGEDTGVVIKQTCKLPCVIIKPGLIMLF